MAKVPNPPKVTDRHSECPKCGAGLEKLIIGGVGDWQRKILCIRCDHIQTGLPRETIVALVAQKYGISHDTARRVDARSQDEYERVVLGGEPFDDLPAVPRTARWKARREAAAAR